MIKILKKPNKKVLKCSYCECLLQYEQDDVRKMPVYAQGWIGYIICPCCETRVYEEGGNDECSNI